MSDTNVETDLTQESSRLDHPEGPSSALLLNDQQSPPNAEIAEMLAQEAAASYFNNKRPVCPSPLLQPGTPLLESKKRRKQATPIRVSNLFEFENKEYVDQKSNGEEPEQGENVEPKDIQMADQERGLMPHEREDWLPMLPFNIFPDGGHLLQKSQFLSKNGFLPFLPGLPSSPPIRIFNPEAYCNLCHKEFCNKYFLKTHKANKHGIYENNTDAQAFGASMRPIKPESLLDPNYFMTKCSVPSEDSTVPSPTGEGNAELACSICPKKFSKALALRRHTIEEHGQTSPPLEAQPLPPPQATPVTSIPSVIINSDTTNQSQTTFPRKLSPESCRMARSAGFAPDYLKKLGILDPEAFCEICCKEYCNKYFLRTHKLKRHGILLTDDTPGGPIKEENQQNDLQSQTSPLNLIMDAKSKHGSLTTNENDTFMESDPASNESDSPVSSNSQDLCKNLQKIQTMILQLNNLQNKDPNAMIGYGKIKDETNGLSSHAREDNCGNMDDNTVIKEEAMNYHDFKRADMFMQGCEPNQRTPDKQPLNASQSIGTPNLSQKNFNIMNSFCEICNKQLCNKYFMKTHMEKMHGIQINNEFKIGGVICDICQKELCSKYFLKVHKQNTHGIFEDGMSATNLNQSASLFPGNLGFPTQFTPPEQMSQYASMPEASESAKEAERSPDKERRMSDSLPKNEQDTDMCPLCGRRFRGSKWLRSHLLNDHGTETREPDSFQASVATNIFDGGPSKTYRCNFCDFSSPILALLFVHERSHISNQTPVPVNSNANANANANTNANANANANTNANANANAANAANAADQGNADVKRFLRDVARRHNLVSSYALPEPRGPDARYEMQPFVLEQFPVENEDPEHGILPAVIYLPVAEKINNKLSVTFSLTPI